MERLLNGVFDCRYYITSEPSEKWGESVVLVLEKVKLTDTEKEHILYILKDKLPKYSVPKRIVCINKFKETRSGKVIRSKVDC